MKILIINQGPFPYYGSTGCSVQLYSIIKSLCSLTHNVRLVSFETSFDDLDEDEALNNLINMGVKTHLINKIKIEKNTGIYKNLTSLLSPESGDFYTGNLYKAEVNPIIDEFQPDHVFAYTFNALTAFDYNKYKIKHSVSMVDIDWLVGKYRYMYRPNKSDKRKAIRYLIGYYKVLRLKDNVIKRLKCVNICFEHAAHHAEYFKSKGVKNVHYFPVNVLPSETNLIFSAATIPLQIALLGNVNGIASLAGLDFFLVKLLPLLAQRKYFNKLQFNIYGGGELRPYLQNIIDKYSNISRKGYVDKISKIYESNNIVFVPTNIPLGFRTRIVEAFSYGKAVVTHKANQLGMPEIQNNVNAFVGVNENDFVQIFEKLIAQPQLITQVGKNAYLTYQEKLNGDINTQKMADIIEQLYL